MSELFEEAVNFVHKKFKLFEETVNFVNKMSTLFEEAVNSVDKSPNYLFALKFIGILFSRQLKR